MKNRKSLGIGTVTLKILKAGGEPMIDMLHKIFSKVFSSSAMPMDWSKMIVSPIHRKSDKSNPENYRAIALLSVPGNVFNKILLERIKDRTEEAVKDTQFGFRPGRGTTDAIFVVRQLMEKAREHKIPLHFKFIDFKSAFDTIWRNAL